MSLVIEAATMADATAIAEVQVASMREAYEGVLPRSLKEAVLEPGRIESRARMMERWLGRARVTTFVARDAGHVIGFCTLHPVRDDPEQPEVGEIASLYLLPECWRRGVGRSLCEHVFEAGRTRGFEEIQLWVLEPNTRARRFYEAVGFEADGRSRVFFENGTDVVRELRYRGCTSARWFATRSRRPVGGESYRDSTDRGGRQLATTAARLDPAACPLRGPPGPA